LEDDDSNHEDYLDNNGNPFDAISSIMVVDEDNEESLKVTHPELLSLCTTLVHRVANDKKEKGKVDSIVQGMIKHYQKETASVVHFDDYLPVLDEHDNSSKENPDRKPGCMNTIEY
jgi:hypothetical protein